MHNNTPANDRPALKNQKIEITPEMIEAGAEAFCRYETDDRPSASDLTQEVLEAALSVAGPNRVQARE